MGFLVNYRTSQISLYYELETVLRFQPTFNRLATDFQPTFNRLIAEINPIINKVCLGLLRAIFLVLQPF